ncbi:MAG: GntR family transcriptional regulator [Aphanocapsa sp. GSE-SYN-MK-11-07L]|nr:GntR family transcriptional regulator [Aphanocapsa sp. GSE-SYN-MK-11-07L]
MKSPLHIKISEQLRAQIVRGEYVPGDQLPSEHELMSLFEVSRITVRRAISNLANQGLVASYHGKGVFVKEQRKVVYSLASPLVFFEQDIQSQGATSTIRNLSFEPVQPPAYVRKLLQLPEQTLEVYLQKKLLLINGIPVALDTSYILSELGEPLAAELQSSMTFPILERHQVAIEKIEATFECTRADRELSAYLETSLGEPLLVYCYTAYTTKNRPILSGTSPCRGDRLSYSVTLTKSD